MIPSVKQLHQWAEVEGEHGEWVRLPSATWIDVLWLLTIFEDMEDNESVQAAFNVAAERRRAGTR